MTVLNLPRDVRYKRENVILCSLIPGPKEPANVNPFLKPLVEELLELWDGVEMAVDGCNKSFDVLFCALVVISLQDGKFVVYPGTQLIMLVLDVKNIFQVTLVVWIILDLIGIRGLQGRLVSIVKLHLGYGTL